MLITRSGLCRLYYVCCVGRSQVARRKKRTIMTSEVRGQGCRVSCSAQALIITRSLRSKWRMVSVYTRRSNLNPLNSKGNSATSNSTNLVYWPLLGVLLHLVQPGGPGRAATSPSSILTVPNVTAHPSTASVPTTVLLYDGPLLYGLMWRLKRVNYLASAQQWWHAMLMQHSRPSVCLSHRGIFYWNGLTYYHIFLSTL